MEDSKFMALVRGNLIDSLVARGGKELTPYLITDIAEEFVMRFNDLLTGYNQMAAALDYFKQHGHSSTNPDDYCVLHVNGSNLKEDKS